MLPKCIAHCTSIQVLIESSQYAICKNALCIAVNCKFPKRKFAIYTLKMGYSSYMRWKSVLKLIDSMLLLSDTLYVSHHTHQTHQFWECMIYNISIERLKRLNVNGNVFLNIIFYLHNVVFNFDIILFIV